MRDPQPDPAPAPDAEPTPVEPALPETPATPSPAPAEESSGTSVEGAGIVPEGHRLSAADDPSVDSTAETSEEDLGPVVWMKYEGIEGVTRTTQVQFDTVWAPRGWTITDAPVEELGSVPGT